MANKKLGLVWEDVPEACVEQAKTNNIVLKEEADCGWTCDNGKPTNLLIEGENYHTLIALQYTHQNKIDLILIDPPYNTGNSDFRYNDKFIDAENGWRHSTWLSFMEKRLRLARNLLSDNGVIAIHIDDNEQHRLRVLCDALFGEENFINNIVWTYDNSTMKNPKKQLASKHEYILCYAKNKDKFNINKIREDEVSKDLIKRFGKYADKDGNIRYGAVKNNEKSYLSRILPRFVKEFGRDPCDDDVIDTLKGNYIRDVINIPGCRTTDLKTKYGIDFEYPKPVALEKVLIRLFSQPSSIILDFFAGSGTTGQAVAELNKEDGGVRQFIIATNNEDYICKSATLPLMEKTIRKFASLRYFKVELIDHSTYKERSDKFARLQVNHNMLGLLMLKYNCFHMVEQTDQHLTLTNEDKSFYLGIYFNDAKKLKPYDIHKVKAFKNQVASYGKEHEVLVNVPGNGFAREYYNFIQSVIVQ